MLDGGEVGVEYTHVVEVGIDIEVSKMLINSLNTFRICIFDGHESYTTVDFIDFLWNHYIIPVLVPAHSSHFLQPADCGPFQPLK